MCKTLRGLAAGRPESQLLGIPTWQGAELGEACSHWPRHQGPGQQAAGVLKRTLKVPCQTPLSFFPAFFSRNHSCVVTKKQG